jgi:hypothetical protein
MSPPPRSNPLSTRSIAVLVLFIVSCLYSSFRLVHNSLHPASPDNVAKLSDERFAALKGALRSRGVVGYVGDSGESATSDYYLTQYALAPLIVDRSTDHELVVGNFPNGRLPQFPSTLQVEKDFGNGVVLLTNKDVH